MYLLFYMHEDILPQNHHNSSDLFYRQGHIDNHRVPQHNSNSDRINFWHNAIHTKICSLLILLHDSTSDKILRPKQIICSSFYWNLINKVDNLLARNLLNLMMWWCYIMILCLAGLCYQKDYFSRKSTIYTLGEHQRIWQIHNINFLIEDFTMGGLKEKFSKISWNITK